MASKASSAPIAVSGNIAPELIEKEIELRRMMRSFGKVLVAYSGGVDSSYLAYVANLELACDAIAILGLSPSVSEVQRLEAREFADVHRLNFREIETEEVNDLNYAANPKNRCYFCKSELYAKLRKVAAEIKVEHIIDGTNADDLGDHRPGRVAADEKGVRSPLAEIGLNKAGIRDLSRFHSLQTWDKPSSPCLSSRIAYGVPVTIERLGQVERAESVVRDVGIKEFRVRVHGELARIEISPGELNEFLASEKLGQVTEGIKLLGFKHVTVDLEGYRSGSLN
jgi:uncharacterized protein